MSTQGRSQRPGTNASREENPQRSASDRKRESFIQFGRAEQAAREAQERALEQSQAQELKAVAGDTIPRDYSSVPTASAIPNAGGTLRASAAYSTYSSVGSAARTYRSTSSAATYRAPYAPGGEAAVSVKGRAAGAHRSQSTSASLREKDARQNPYAAARRRLYPLLFLCAAAALIGLISVFVSIRHGEALLKEEIGKSMAAAEMYAATNPMLRDIKPLHTGILWASFWPFLLMMSGGFAASVAGWRTSGRWWAVMSAALFGWAILNKPELWVRAAPALAIALLSSYVLLKAHPTPNRGRRQDHRR